MEWEDVLKHMEEEKKKKNFRNWINKVFPNGYASYNSYYILTHPWEILREWKRQIKYAWQRVFRGWDDRATWSMDYHLSKVIPEMIRELKRVSIGVPIGMFEGMEEITLPNGIMSYSEEDEKIATERWHKILDDLIAGFEGYNKIDDLDTYEEQELAYTKFFTETFELFKKHYRDLWW